MDTLWHWLMFALFGLVAGAIARFLVPGRQSMGILATMILGMVGSLLGGFIGSLFTGGDAFSPAGWIMSIIGAIIVLLIYIWATGRSVRHTVR